MRTFLYTLILMLVFGRITYSQIDPQNIDIVRDTWGVPHIYASTDPEVAYGLAWAHAEDDFKTIQGTLSAGKGMAGSLFGKEGAAIDFFTHFIGTYELVSEKKSSLSTDFRNLLEGYLSGINAYAEKHPNDVLHKDLFPVKEEDMLRAFVLSLTSMSQVDEILGKINADHSFKNPYTGIGSNAIAIHRSRTSETESFLAVNSHQPFEGPASWYEAHLHSEEGWNILGALFPGSPTIFHGVNEHLGWAHTVNYPDMVDLYQLKMLSEKDLSYVVDGKIHYLKKKKAALRVKLFGPFAIKLKKVYFQSIYGPTLENKNGFYALNFSANGAIKAIQQWYEMTKASSHADFVDAMEPINLPNFNTLYADKDTIFYVSNAKLPIRNPSFDWTTTVRADTSATLWDQFHSFNELPQYTNPKSGYLYNMNHSPFLASSAEDQLIPSRFPEEMGFLTSHNNRSIRFTELISKQSRVSYNDFKRIKFDIQYPKSFHFPYDLNIFFGLSAEDYPQLAEFLSIIQNWDRNAAKESIGAGLVKLLLNRMEEKDYNEEEAVKLIAKLQKDLLSEFGTLEIPLSAVQIHQRGDREYPIDGLPDVIAPMYTKAIKKEKFKEKAVVGESYILLARFGQGLPKLESISPYGASSDPESKHYTDQMPLFVNKELKTMSLDKEYVYENAERIYHPE